MRRFQNFRSVGADAKKRLGQERLGDLKALFMPSDYGRAGSMDRFNKLVRQQLVGPWSSFLPAQMDDVRFGRGCVGERVFVQRDKDGEWPLAALVSQVRDPTSVERTDDGVLKTGFVSRSQTAGPASASFNSM
jgi:hypothetical protein